MTDNDTGRPDPILTPEFDLGKPQANKEEEGIAWEKDLDKLSTDYKLVQLAYAKTNESELLRMEDIPEGYNLLCFTDYVDEFDMGHEYRAVIMINQHSKEITIANAGTRMSSYQKASSDLKDDAKLTLGMEVNKLSSIKKVNDKLLEFMTAEELDLKDYSLHYTGHSLGGYLAGVGAADMAIKMKEKGISLQVGNEEEKKKRISVSAFDAPGCKSAVTKIYLNSKQVKLASKKQVSSKQLLKIAATECACQDINFKTYLHKRNIINKTGSHIGEVFTIVKEHDKSKHVLRNMFTRLLSNIFMIIPNVLRLMKDFIGYHIGTHKMENFDQVLVKKEGVIAKSVNKPTSFLGSLWGKQEIEFDKKIYSEIKALQAKNGHVGRHKYMMQIPGNVISETKDSKPVTFSRVELIKAIKNIRQRENIVIKPSYTSRVKYHKPLVERLPNAIEVSSQHTGISR